MKIEEINEGDELDLECYKRNSGNGFTGPVIENTFWMRVIVIKKGKKKIKVKSGHSSPMIGWVYPDRLYKIN